MFKAIRGLTPKVYAGNVPGLLYLFFIPDGSHIVEVHDWKKFIGEEIKVKGTYLQELIKKHVRCSKFFKLKEVKGENAIIEDIIFNFELTVPLNQIYAPANTRLLYKFDVLKVLQGFTSFRINSGGGETTEYKFLEKALEEFLTNKEIFQLKIGLTNVIFHKVKFGLGEPHNEFYD